MFLHSIACMVLAASSLSANCQMADIKPDSSKPLASPAATANATLGSATISITYNAPSIRGRKIMGGLVPYGQVWRTGANPATTITTSTDLHFGSMLVPAGTHTLYTLPGESSPWQLIINKQTGQWGTEYDMNQDLGRVPMSTPKKSMTGSQEVMSITFEHTTATSTELHVRWETTDRLVIITK